MSLRSPDFVRAVALALLLAAFVVFLSVQGLNHEPSAGLPLADVPESELTRVGVTLTEPTTAEPPITEYSARGLATDIACCGRIQQASLLEMHFVGEELLAWAINFDTSTAPRDLPHGGYWRTGFTPEQAFFVLFLDAMTGKHVFTLAPGSEFPPPQETGVSFDGIEAADLSRAGIRADAPQPGDFATWTPDHETVFESGQVDGGMVTEVLLAKMDADGEPPYLRGRLVWVANVNVGERLLGGNGGTLPSPPYQLSLIFLDPDNGAYLWEKDIFINN